MNYKIFEYKYKYKYLRIKYKYKYKYIRTLNSITINVHHTVHITMSSNILFIASWIICQACQKAIIVYCQLNNTVCHDEQAKYHCCYTSEK